MTFGFQHMVLNSTTVRGMLSSNFNPRLSGEGEASDGRLHYRAHHFTRSAPMFEGTSRDLQTLATLFSGNADVPSLVLTAAKMFGAQKNATAPGFAAGTTHRQIAGTDGWAALTSLSWSASSPKVECGFQGFLLSADGTTVPYTETDVALPTQEGAVVPYTLTGLTLGGDDVLQGTISLSFDIQHGSENNNADSCYSGGLPHPKMMAHAGPHGQVMITGTIEHQDVTLSPSNGDIVATFTALQEGGFLGSDTVVATLNGTVDPELAAGGSHGSPLSRGITCHGLFDGTNKPFTLTP